MATSATLSFGLAFEAGEKDIMNRPPRKSNLHVMDGYAIWRVVFVGLMIAISAFVLEARCNRAVTRRSSSAPCCCKRWSLPSGFTCSTAASPTASPE